VPLLLLLFIVVPLVELYVILQVGQAIGVLPTIALLVADSILGSVLMRSQGRQAWRRFNASTAAGKVPGREVLDGALIIFGGALLLTPGFTTDLLGLLLLLPPTRAAVRRVLLRGVLKRMVVATPFGPAGAAGVFAARRAAGARRGPAGPGGPAGQAGPAFDVEGTATDVRPVDEPGPRRLP
jgi:UPF0716 protein FxsA